MDNVKHSFSEFTNFDSESHLKAKPPKEAYLYFPTETEKIEFDKKKPKKTLRKIFENVSYNDYESERLNDFKAFVLSQKSESFQYGVTMSEADILRYLQAAEYDNNKTYKSILSTLEWRKANLPVKLNENIIKILNSGFMYIHGRDNKFRPIIVVQTRIYNKKLYTYEDWKNAVIFIVEYVVNNMMLPGQVENWVICNDLKDVALYSIPSELIKMTTMVQDNYKCRLYNLNIINMGSFASLFLILVKKILGESVERKLRLINSKDVLFTSIEKSQVKQIYGGTEEEEKCSHISGQLFPPCMPALQSILSCDLVSEEEYLQIVGNNPGYVRSPYIRERLSFSEQGNLLYDGESFYTARDHLSLENEPESKTKNECVALETVENEYEVESNNESYLAQTNGLQKGKLVKAGKGGFCPHYESEKPLTVPESNGSNSNPIEFDVKGVKSNCSCGGKELCLIF